MLGNPVTSRYLFALVIMTMSVEQTSPVTLSAGLSKKTPSHPLSPLTASEITRASALIRALYPPKIDLHFKAVTLEEPEKAHLVPYLEAEYQGRRLPSLERKAFVCYYIRNTVRPLIHNDPRWNRGKQSTG